VGDKKRGRGADRRSNLSQQSGLLALIVECSIGLRTYLLVCEVGMDSFPFQEVNAQTNGCEELSTRESRKRAVLDRKTSGSCPRPMFATSDTYILAMSWPRELQPQRSRICLRLRAH